MKWGMESNWKWDPAALWPFFASGGFGNFQHNLVIGEIFPHTKMRQGERKKREKENEVQKSRMRTYFATGSCVRESLEPGSKVIKSSVSPCTYSCQEASYWDTIGNHEEG